MECAGVRRYSTSAGEHGYHGRRPMGTTDPASGRKDDRVLCDAAGSGPALASRLAFVSTDGIPRTMADFEATAVVGLADGIRSSTALPASSWQFGSTRVVARYSANLPNFFRTDSFYRMTYLTRQQWHTRLSGAGPASIQTGNHRRTRQRRHHAPRDAVVRVTCPIARRQSESQSLWATTPASPTSGCTTSTHASTHASHRREASHRHGRQTTSVSPFWATPVRTGRPWRGTRRWNQYPACHRMHQAWLAWRCRTNGRYVVILRNLRIDVTDVPHAAAIPLGGGLPIPLLAGAEAPHSFALSPNGKWIAYEARNTRNYEIYIRPFAAGSGKH